MATERQKKAVAEMVENGRNKSKGQILKEVGYSNAVSIAPTKVTESKGFKEESKPIVAQLIKKRQEAINNLSEKIDKASYNDLTSGIDRLTKNIELLSGRDTERQGVTLSEKQEERLHERLKKKYG